MLQPGCCTPVSRSCVCPVCTCTIKTATGARAAIRVLERESVSSISAVTVAVVRGGRGGGRTQLDRRQPWFGAEPEEELGLRNGGGVGGGVAV